MANKKVFLTDFRKEHNKSRNGNYAIPKSLAIAIR